MIWLRLFNLLMAVFMLAPLVLILWMSFTPFEMFRLPTDTLSLRWYREAFNYPGFLNAFFLSARLALVTALAASVMAFLAAYALVRFRFPGRRFFEALFLAPLLVPGVVLGIALLQYVNAIGLYNTFWALVLAHVAIVTPFALRSIQAQIRAVPEDLEWAAMNLGASRLQAMLRITVPLTARAVLAGFVLAFIISFAEVTVTIFMTGPAYPTLPVRIYNYLSDQVDPTVAAISAMLIVLSLALVLLLDRLGGLRTLAK
ncbi:MAG: ABC transporter permease [Alphaproteobacteria bacterium]|nr:ABC transporter permease [Alphaproteobacteria bacterium]